MNLSCGYLLCCYLFCLFLFSPILIHLSILCQFNIGEVYSWYWIRFTPGGCVLIFQFYLIVLKYHHKFCLRLLKREYSSLSHFLIRSRPDNNVSGWLFNTTLHLDDQCMVVGPYYNQLNRCKCVFCNIIDAFWRCLDGGCTCLCICYNVGWD